jgi:carbamoyltransferase
MKIVGFHSGHDSAYSILEDGIPTIHNELERFNRRKNSVANSIQFFLDNEKDLDDIKYMVTHRTGGMVDNKYMDSFNRCQEIIEKNGGELYIIGHHQSHAANAFFTSDYEEALIVTIDGGGIDNGDGSLHNKSDIDTIKNALVTCTTFWSGKGNKIKPLEIIPNGAINLGKDWSMCTSKIFGLGTWRDPRGDQAGTVMGMAALGNSEKYMSYFENKLTDGLFGGDGAGSIDFDYLKKEADKEEQNRFDISASLQKETEKVIRALLTPYIEKHKPKNLCLSGGVSLNCVSIGKMLDWFPGINIFVDPIPYDAGLSLGSSRYVWHQILDNPRIYKTPKNKSPYLGYTYSEKEIQKALDDRSDEIEVMGADDDYVVYTMINKKIISVFGGGSESGRRALGNRSILADPTHAETKDIVNDRVKHRQWFRPFAPSILRDYVKDWFVHDVGSPYMNIAMKFKEGMSKKVPAVVHFDDTARLQTVRKEDNEWYYNFIDNFRQKTGVPIVLNTSFNDREPIVETPEHALDCFLRTNIDYLYFRDYGILVSKAWKK